MTKEPNRDAIAKILDLKEEIKILKNAYIVSETQLRTLKDPKMKEAFNEKLIEELESERRYADELMESLKKCVELCVCQTESEMFIDEAKEALAKYDDRLGDLAEINGYAYSEDGVVKLKHHAKGYLEAHKKAEVLVEALNHSFRWSQSLCYAQFDEQKVRIFHIIRKKINKALAKYEEES